MHDLINEREKIGDQCHKFIDEMGIKNSVQKTHQKVMIDKSPGFPR